MLMNLIMSMMLASTSIAFLSHTPLQLGLCILMLAMLTALNFAMSLSIWMSFLIFLIYIGGMLIMFSYFIATSPNMKISLMFMLSAILILTPMFMILLNMSKTYVTPMMNPWTQSTTFYNMYHLPTLILMALALLITLIIVVKVSNTTKGPLRPFNKYV